MLEGATDPFGTLLKQFRKQRQLTQQQLAEALGVHRNTVGRWEEGSFLPESKALVLDLARCLHLDEQEALQLLDASMIAPTPLWSVPYPRNPFFTGREELLAELHARLGPGQQATLTQSYALHGLGGIGKTQIALEYAYRSALEYHAIFWIGAETVEQIHASLLHIAEQLDLSERTKADQQQMVAAVQRWLKMHGEWLLIWDNLEDLDLLRPWLLSGKQGAILITTRNQALGPLGRGIGLSPMKREESLLLVLRRARVLEPEATNTDLEQIAVSQPGEYAAASELATVLGGLPLALDQAGAYIEETGCSLVDYLHRYEQQRRQLLDRRGIAGEEHPHSVTATFQLSYERVHREQPAAKDLLCMCAFLNAEAIPEAFFVAGAAHLGPVLELVAADPVRFDLMIAALRHLSLIQRHPETHTFSLHRLVQAVLQDQLAPDEARLWSERVICIVNAAFPKGVAFANWQACEQALLHVQRCAEVSERYSLQTPEAARLFHEAGSYLLERGRFSEAERLLTRALTTREHISGLQHPSVALTLQCLSDLFSAKRQYEQAEPLLLRALAVWEKEEKSFPFEMAKCLGDLAGLYSIWGKYEQVEPLLQRALVRCREHLGMTHPYTLECTCELAGYYGRQGNFPLAISMLQQALDLWEEHISTDDQMVNMIRSNLGVFYDQQGAYAQAEVLFQRSLAFREQHLGPTHPYTIIVLNNLAAHYRDQGKYEQAESLYLRAITNCEASLGPDSPELTSFLLGLGKLYFQQGRYEQAISLVRRALAGSQQHVGLENPQTALCLYCLGALYLKQEHYEDAERFLSQSLAINERHLVPDHPQIADTLHDLSIVYQKQGSLSKAISFAERALRLRVQTLGDTHPKTVATREYHARLLQEDADGSPV